MVVANQYSPTATAEILPKRKEEKNMRVKKEAVRDKLEKNIQ